MKAIGNKLQITSYVWKFHVLYKNANCAETVPNKMYMKVCTIVLEGLEVP